MSKIEKLQRMSDKNIGEITKLIGNVQEMENKNKAMCDTIGESNEKMCNEIKRALKERNVKRNVTYAQAIKDSDTMMPDVSKPIVIKPKEKQNISQTKNDLNSNVDPTNLKIINVENRRNGTVVIQTENETEREKIRLAVQNGLNENYEVKVPNPAEMSIKITGMTFKYTEEELIAKIKAQNENLSSTEIKNIKFYEVKRNNITTYNAKVNLDNESYKIAMNAGKINIGWERCRIFDGTDVLQCFKCKGYNHKAKDCKNQEVCNKCHGNHKSKDCQREQMMKCINCIHVNKNLKLDLDENHFTNSKQCPVYMNKLSAKKRRRGISA
ncbi:uncharacterized protein LOC142239631 [Haematobia irritans]|uniref:uncharacterized protein LOC142239631 n=1 Tax=Haematobia irritans TaxID=7368 RepID=UPI003F4FF451